MPGVWMALGSSAPEDAFGRAVADLWADPSVRPYLFPFRMSGVMP